MNALSPFVARVGIAQRSTHLVDLVTRDTPLVTDYRLWVARSLDDAYGTVVDSGIAGSGGRQILEARVARTGALAASTSVIQRGWAGVAGVRRGQTTFMFDPDDFVVPAPPNPSLVPSDGEYLYARIQECRTTVGWAKVDAGAIKNAGFAIRGSILVVPNAGFFGAAASVLSLFGHAPAATGCTEGNAPVFDPSVQTPMPMHIVFPRPMGSLTIRNTDAAADLLVCFGLGQPMIKVPKGTSVLPTGGGYSLPGVTELILARSGVGADACVFSLDGVIGFTA